MNRRLGLIPLLLLFALVSNAQQFPLNFRFTLMAGYNGPDQVPFWIRSNQFGSVPPTGASMGLIGSAYKHYNRTEDNKLDWGFGAEGRLNLGNPSKFILLEAYGRIRYSIFELKAGRVKEITGLCDTLLSSGSWSVSGNAPGIPEIQVGIPEYYYLPIFDRLFAIKGSYSNGLMGNWYINSKEIPNTPSYLIQHTLYGQLGKQNWKIKLFGGFNHQVVWGDEKDILGQDYQLNGFQTFIYANIAKRYNNDSIRQMRVGNHLGSIDLGFTFTSKTFELFVYHQAFYDAGGLYYLANLRDGLNGISIKNRNPQHGNFRWNRFLVEFLYSKNQAGETWSPHTTSPYEAYYNNSYYDQGWSYNGKGIGSPFMSMQGTLKEGLPESGVENFSNNRVWMLHAGLELSYSALTFVGRFSYSSNYGTYLTSPEGKIYNGENTEHLYGIFPETRQFSGMIEVSMKLKNSVHIGLTGAMDIGKLYKNSSGIMASLSKSI